MACSIAVVRHLRLRLQAVVRLWLSAVRAAERVGTLHNVQPVRQPLRHCRRTIANAVV